LTSLIQLNKKDALDIVKIHSIAFPRFFLTELGKDVLRVFYAALIQDKSTIVWGLKNDEQLVGFFVASTTPSGLYTRIFQRHFFSFFAPLTISFLKNIRLVRRMITSIISSRSFVLPSEYPASLLSICVSPSFAGKGIGKLLLGKLEDELIHQQINGYYLTTDKENNEATNQFYLRNGFKLFDVFSQGKRKMNIYLKDLK
jgi:GNAT superfamily N-acetyltransferase